MEKRNRPEVLAPAGDRERLAAAVQYGADAVYLGGKDFGMRASPLNFTEEELAQAVADCHRQGVKVISSPGRQTWRRYPLICIFCRKSGWMR